MRIIIPLLVGGAAAFALAPPAHADADAVRRAEAALAAGDAHTARVELLNAIQDDPADGRAHLLQARVYIALGDGIAAEAEVDRARQSGIRAGATRHVKGEALLAQGEAQRALAEASSPDVLAPYAARAARIRGRALVVLGDTASAEPEFDRAVALAPRDAGTWTDMGRFRLATGDTADAVAAADRAVTLDSHNIDALLLKGQLARGQYGLRAAMPWFDRALAIDRDNIAALLEKAATLGDMGQARAMLAMTRRIIALDAGNAPAFYLQAVLAARARKFELARAIMQRTGGALDGVPAAMLLMGVIDIQTGNTQQAIDRLSRLVAMQPENLKARRVLGAAQWRAGDVQGTIATLRPSADLPQADSYTLTLIGRAFERRGDRRTAAQYLDRAAMPARAAGIGEAPIDPRTIAMLRAAAAERPRDAEAHIAVIRALLRSGDRDAALAAAVALQQANPGAPQAHVIVGDSLAEMGRWGDAAAAYRRAANIGFSEPVALRLIDALRRAGDAAGAAQVLHTFLSQNPQNIPAQLMAAELHMATGEWQPAITILQRLRARLGDRDTALLNNLAWATFSAGRSADGIAVAERAHALSPANPAVADTLGWLLFKTGRNRPRGLALIERAAAQDPGESGIHWHLGQAYAASSRPADARAAAESALALPGFEHPAEARALIARL